MIAVSKEKKPHRFFETILENDLDDLYLYLKNKHKDMLEGKIETIPAKELEKFNELNGAPTQLGHYYNVFNFEHEGIQLLKNALSKTVEDASNYYGFDFNSMSYMIHGWFNLDYKSEGGKVSPIERPEHYHDHMGGEGAPVYHGYYCVNAEPSITYYKINNEIDFENYNKNNRAIVSETGHPHGRDDWYQDKPRITIAYDICPAYMDIPTDIWIRL